MIIQVTLIGGGAGALTGESFIHRIPGERRSCSAAVATRSILPAILTNAYDICPSPQTSARQLTPN